MAGTYQDAWNDLVVKCQYDTGGMEITEFQKSLIVWADCWVRAAQQSVQPTDGGLAQADSESNPPTISG